MIDWLTSLTSLPNLHPALVHLPIALAPLAAVIDLAAALLRRQREWLARGAALLWVLTAGGAGLAYWAGQQAEDSFVDLAPQLHARIEQHADLALYTLWALGLLAAARLLAARAAVRRPGPSLVAGLLGLGAVVLVVRTADLGGALVYRHGVGVSTPPSAPAPDEDRAAARAAGTAAPAAPVAESALAALARQLAPLGDASDVATLGDVAEGVLPITVDGRVVLVLPSTHTDVQVDAELDLTAFRGVVGLAHHVTGPNDFGALAYATASRQLALETRRAGEPRHVLGRAELRETSGPVRLGVYAAGRHQRGLVDGETRLHGHTGALPPGRVGLLLEGRGVVGVRAWSITSLSPEGEASSGAAP